MTRGDQRRPRTSLYEMIHFVSVICICDLADVWRPPTSYDFHPLLFLVTPLAMTVVEAHVKKRCGVQVVGQPKTRCSDGYG